MAVQQRCRSCSTWLAEKARLCRSCGAAALDKSMVCWRVDRKDGRGRRIREVCGSFERAVLLDHQVHIAQLGGQAWRPIPPARVALSDLADTYLSDERVSAMRDYRVRRSAIMTAVGHLGGDRSLATLSTEDAHQYQRLRQHAGITGSTINRELGYLSIMLDWHAATGRISSNPIRGFVRMRENEARERVAEPHELEAIANHAPECFRPLVAVLASLPLRSHEALALRWAEDGKNPWLDLSQRRGYIVIPKGVAKSSRARDVPIYYQDVREMLAALPSRFARGPVFLTEQGRPLYSRMVGEMWREACVAAGVENLHIHDLKHTAITWLALYGLPAAELAYVSDHSTAAMQQRYTNVQREHMRRPKERWYNPATGMVERTRAA